jgi:hypothetical protein
MGTRPPHVAQDSIPVLRANLIFAGIPHERAFTDIRMKISTKVMKIDEGFFLRVPS